MQSDEEKSFIFALMEYDVPGTVEHILVRGRALERLVIFMLVFSPSLLMP